MPKSSPSAPAAIEQRNFALALGVSVVLHAVVLSIHFKLPQALGRATERALDVILVNSKSAQRPSEAQARAQAHLDGGGNTDENRRLKTPLPSMKQQREGDAVQEAQRRIAELEAQQRQMMTQARSAKTVAANTAQNEPTPPAPTPPKATGADLAANALAMMRLSAEISRNIDEYNKRPKKAFIGARASEYRFAQYVEDWRQKVERIGNLNYPEAARGKLYGSLVISVTIKADGSIKEIFVDRPSGHRVLDDAARRIIQLAAPYAPFTADIARDTDEIVISRTWSFTNADRLHAD